MSSVRTGPPLEEIAENVRRARQQAGLSLSELARRCGVSKSTLSQLETGTGNPSVETLWAVATALDLPFSALVETRESAPARLVRASERAGVGAADASGYAASLLSAGRGVERRDLYVIDVEQGSPHTADPHPRGSVEHVVVGGGRLRVGPADDPVELGVGDYLSFAGDVPHGYEALEPGSWFVLMMHHPGSGSP